MRIIGARRTKKHLRCVQILHAQASGFITVPLLEPNADATARALSSWALAAASSALVGPALTLS